MYNIIMPLIIKVLDFIAGTLLLSGWWTGPLFSIWRYIYIINLVFKMYYCYR